MAHGVVCHFDLPHMAQKVADWTRREGRPRAMSLVFCKSAFGHFNSAGFWMPGVRRVMQRERTSYFMQRRRATSSHKLHLESPKETDKAGANHTWSRSLKRSACFTGNFGKCLRP